MAKKFGKLLALTAVLGAAAGAIYYYKSKEEANDSFDDFDDFEDEGDAEIDDFLENEAVSAEKAEKSIRDFIPLNLSSETVDEARATIKKAAAEIGGAVIGTVDKVSGLVRNMDADIEEFDFDDLKPSEDDYDEPSEVIVDKTEDLASKEEAASTEDSKEE